MRPLPSEPVGIRSRDRTGDTGTAGDTRPEALHVLDELYLEMSPAEKLGRVRDLTLAANAFALAGLSSRHPGESRGALLLRLARLRLGDDVVEAAYGEPAGP